jgi:hypothetical protein
VVNSSAESENLPKVLHSAMDEVMAVLHSTKRAHASAHARAHTHKHIYTQTTLHNCTPKYTHTCARARKHTHTYAQVNKLSAEKHSLQQENKMLKSKLQIQTDLTLVLQQECAHKDMEIQRLHMQREIDKDKRAELSCKLEEVMENISALQRERNMKLDAAVTGQVCFINVTGVAGRALGRERTCNTLTTLNGMRWSRPLTRFNERRSERSASGLQRS